ncbi:N-acetylglucosamine kinase [Agromyces ramosus]|uniref:Glucosamine kinase n=1 Tax=Agromyces ramosus TaxID=33879 RepID=A0ABU0R831_9MICO|nr:BadF/BadG/BcrA/BcrD ATPase family protein [Agromyces ramosus]MDQ0894220.1 glucosamine kinase [Agromyces ramosus]
MVAQARLSARADADGPQLLAIDAGQSGIKVRHQGAGARREWTSPAIRTDLPLLPQLIGVIDEAASRGAHAEAVGIGVSGLTRHEFDAEPLFRAAAPALGATSVTLAHDSVTAYLGALGADRGVAIASGTGAVAFAVGARRVARIDGWGNVIGDAGSAFWLGREALDAVMRAHDGRGPATALTEVVAEEFPDVETAYIELQVDPARVERIARFAPGVSALADVDGVARRIISRAAQELALSAYTGLRRVEEDRVPRPRVRVAGGVFRSELLLAEFAGALRMLVPDAEIETADADPLAGAALLPGVDESSSIATLISRARS